MKRNEQLSELRELDDDALEQKISGMKEELMKLRFRHSSGQLETTATLSEIRKNIARAKTLQQQRASEAN